MRETITKSKPNSNSNHRRMLPADRAGKKTPKSKEASILEVQLQETLQVRQAKPMRRMPIPIDPRTISSTA